MAMLETWDKFAERVRRTASHVQFLLIEEETFRVDHALALYEAGIPRQKIWPEYPYPLSPKNGVDIYADSSPQQYMEIKYLRGLTTGSQRPRTMWLGMLLADIYKLAAWVGNADKFMLLAADGTFTNFLHNKGIKVTDIGQDASHTIKLVEVPDSRETPVSQGLAKTAMKKLREQLKEIPSKPFTFSCICCRSLNTQQLSVFLLKIKITISNYQVTND
jgi:hypothetical protein